MNYYFNILNFVLLFDITSVNKYLEHLSTAYTSCLHAWNKYSMSEHNGPTNRMSMVIRSISLGSVGIWHNGGVPRAQPVGRGDECNAGRLCVPDEEHPRAEEAGTWRKCMTGVHKRSDPNGCRMPEAGQSQCRSPNTIPQNPVTSAQQFQCQPTTDPHH